MSASTSAILAIPATQRAVVFHAVGPASALKVETVPAPQPAALPDGAIIVHNKAIGVNFVDILYRNGVFPHAAGAPLGVEGAGVVVASRNPRFAAGDRVLYDAPHGGYAEYIQIDAPSSVAVIPDALSFDQAAAVVVQGLTALALYRKAHATQPGQTVVVTAAAGGVGQALVQIGKRVVGARVIGVTSSDDKAALVRAAGADEVIVVPRGGVAGGAGVDNHPLVTRVLELTDGRGADAVFDSVGRDVFDAALASLAPYGAYVQFGATSGPVPPFEVTRLSAKNIRLHWHSLFADLAHPAGFQTLAPELIDAVASGKFAQPVYKTYALDDVAQAHADLESGRTHGKLLIHP